MKRTYLKDEFEFNDFKTQLTGQPNPNKEMASSAVKKQLKTR
jgi:hypothetical protein